MAAMKHIAFLSTGGTIASAPAESGRSISGALPGSQLLSHTGLEGRFDVSVHSVFQAPSNAIGPAEWLKLAAECRQLIDSGEVDGIVITHGTDTLEDTAYFLECVLDTSKVPVVVTGSQRVPHALGSDAYANLRYAIELAASDEAAGMGVLVSFNQSVYSANFVRKVSSFQLNGFDAPGLGTLGFFDEGRFHVLQRPMRQRALDVPKALPRVDILPVYGGADAAVPNAVLASGPKGVVIDGLGRGHVPPSWMDELHPALQNGLPMLVCTSTLHGPTYQTYEFVGSLADLEAAGAIAVSHLSARKSRIRLALLLAAGITQPDAIRQAFQWQPDRC